MNRRIGILYHPRVPEAQILCEKLTQVLQNAGFQVWATSAWEEQRAKERMVGTDAVVSIGGDGTILRAAKAVLPAAIPILGVRYGRLGFIAEVPPEAALERVPALLQGGGYLEERSMLQARCAITQVDPELTAKHYPLMQDELTQPDPCFHALNDVAIARGGAGRPITVHVAINSQFVNSYRADAVIVATATGSTGYALAAGGPVLYPTSRCFVLIPASAHATLPNALVLEPATVVQLTVQSDHGSMLSIDGQADIPLKDGETVTVEQSPYVARFIRATSSDDFYANLLARLRFGESIDP